ncbi:DUF2207 domain-containing protein [Microbacterium sp. dk485]|uniref:DUF2207 domain-containing protein n=1 Tax=Microbacterium sp. dk485 TaxID=2560021 RepID=UPI0010730E81|nr:DUF2207 domain-containing protein [Microbacterium sp. dk485]TFV82589.1 DUF2207 domain-containing protein [Microbacterium sp. dk485]
MSAETPGIDLTVEPPPDGAVPVETRRPTRLYRGMGGLLLRLEARARAKGSRRVRLTNALVWLLVAAAGQVLLTGPVINEPLSLEDITSAAGEVTEHWIAHDVDARFELERTDDGRLLVHVEEQITADFPEGVEETGITRTIASHYEGHDLHPRVTGGEFDGDPVEVAARVGATATSLTWDTGSVLTGRHEFVVRYTLSDVAYPEQDASTGRLQDLLEWDILGPSWGQGIRGVEMTLIVPRELHDALERTPRAAMSWTLLADATTLTPDSETADAVTYVVTVDQNMPPHTDIWFTLRFAEGTFTMPDPAPLYWVLVVGPFVPLLLLAVGLLFVLAARALVWNDARGRAWFVPQYEPDPRVPAPLASRLMRQVLTAPLVQAISDGHAGIGERPITRIGRIAWRTGRPWHLWPEWRTYLFAPAWREQFVRKLRRVPRGIVRDVFIGATLALTLVQFGLVRQLSYQVILSVYWWPLAIVAATIALALVILVIALSARPLTRAGALAREHLLGLRLYLEQTRMDERITLRDELLPYVVMFAKPRRAREIVRRLLDERGHRDPGLRAGFFTAARLGVRAAAMLAVVGAIVVAAALPSPSQRSAPEDLAYSGDLPGSRGWLVSEITADARLERTEAGKATVTVTETLTVFVEEERDTLPQVMRQWRDVVHGHDTGLEVTEVTVDGDPVPYEQRREEGMAFVQTQLTRDWGGEHTVQIRYRLTDAAAAVQQDGRWYEHVQWTALNEGWRDAWSWPEQNIERVAMTVRVPAELRAQLHEDSGVLEGDLDVEAPGLPAVTSGAGGEDVYRWELLPDADGRWTYEASRDVGIRFVFPAGTFADVGQESWWLDSAARALPTAVPLVLLLGAAGCALLGLILRLGGVRRVSEPGLLREVVRWIPPWFALAGSILFVWRTADSVDDDPLFPLLGLPAVAAVVLAIANHYATRRRS